MRDMGAPLNDIVRLRNATASGALVGPRLFIAGPLIAKAMDVSNDVGTIEVGKAADLVLLDADPLKKYIQYAEDQCRGSSWPFVLKG